MPLLPEFLAHFIVSHLPDSLIAVIDPDLRYLLAGGEAARQPAEALKGQRLSEALSASETELLEPHYRAALAGERRRFEHERDGNCYREDVLPIPDPAGGSAVVAALSVARDISEFRRTEQALREIELRHRLVVAGSSAGIWEWIPAEWMPGTKLQDEIWLSPRFCELLGYEPEDFSPDPRKTWRSLVHPQELALAQQAMERHLRTRVPLMHEYRLLCKHGEYRWFLLIAQAAWDEQGSPLRVAGSISDIHAQKLLEQERQMQLDVIFEQAYDLMAVLNPAGRIVNANRSLLAMLGQNREATLQQFCWSLPCWKSAPEVAQRLRSAILLAAEGQEVRYEELMQAASGRLMTLDLSIKPALGPRNEVFSLILEGRDISALKQTQHLAEKTSQLLRHHNRQLENFAHITSHNLRSPATNIHMLINLYETAANAEERDYAISKLKESSHRLMETLDILADNLSIRMDTSVERAPLNFSAALERVRGLLAAELDATHAELIADFSLCPMLEYPPSYLDSILLNLISNALKYRSPERTPVIRLHSWIEQQRVNLRVSDNGIGINLKRHADKIFGLYKTFHRNRDAHGVGLFITKSQIEALGGTIGVKSEPEVGTTFHIVF